ncbi:putative nuclease HARBI1 [Littorina saxatilis]|uniref:putative nuclease HARBI1 n=1 Tax=Littorina saxatilis TaxID=31220 RepID=UPI0038B6A19F
MEGDQFFFFLLMQHNNLHLRQLALVQELMRRRRRRPPAFWVRPWLTAQRRLMYGHFHCLMRELRIEDTASFFNFMRMEPQMFDELVDRLSPRITLQDTNCRKALEPGLKVAVTLRHLASGDRYPSLSYAFRVSRHTIAKFLPLVCQAIVDEYKDEVIACPTTAEEWQAIADEFERKWNVPHAVGALDGKHVAIRKPPQSGSLYYNYKGFFSLVMLALVDADYNFIWVDVGAMGHMSDAQIYSNASEVKECFEDGTINLPPPQPMTNDDRPIPYFMLADDAFALRTYLMKPYSKRGMTDAELITNYRISRGRRVVENAFGILASRWQVLHTTLQQHPKVATSVVEAAVCLHNLMRMRYPRLQNAELDIEDAAHNIVPGDWRRRAPMHGLYRVRGANQASTEAKRQREYLRLYFNSPAGAVPWQQDMIRVRRQ